MTINCPVQSGEHVGKQTLPQEDARAHKAEGSHSDKILISWKCLGKEESLNPNWFISNQFCHRCRFDFESSLRTERTKLLLRCCVSDEVYLQLKQAQAAGWSRSFRLLQAGGESREFGQKCPGLFWPWIMSGPRASFELFYLISAGVPDGHSL